MSLVTVASALPAIPDIGEPFAQIPVDVHTPGGSFSQYPQALQRLWEVMWGLTGFGKEEIRITTEKLAELCDRCERWVYKALRQGLEHEVDGEPAPLIAKRFVKGPREAAGRVLSLIVNFVKAKDPEPPKPKAREKTRARANTPAASPVPAGPSEPETPAPAGAWAAFRETLGLAAAAMAPSEKTEAESAAEAQRKKDAFEAAARKRREDKARREVSDTPEPKPRE